MAMGMCNECGHAVSNDAATCPSCGKANPAGKGTTVGRALVTGAALLLALLLAVVMCGKLSSSGTAGGPMSVAAPSAVPVVQVDAMTLWREYDANEVAADLKYKGQMLAVTGTVFSIDKNFADDIIVRLESPNSFRTIMATLHDSQVAAAARLTKGSNILMSCRGAGSIMGSPSLNDCVVP